MSVAELLIFELLADRVIAKIMFSNHIFPKLIMGIFQRGTGPKRRNMNSSSASLSPSRTKIFPSSKKEGKADDVGPLPRMDRCCSSIQGKAKGSFMNKFASVSLVLSFYIDMVSKSSKPRNKAAYVANF